jgi:hypothetical protein
MERHDPLGQIAPAVETPPEPPPLRKRSRKPPPLLRALLDVKDETLAFLYGGPNQTPSDYQRNLEQAGQLRQSFTAFCEANLHYPDWRQAWAAYVAQRQDEEWVEFAPVPETLPPIPKPSLILQMPAQLPKWRQRLQTAVFLYGT